MEPDRPPGRLPSVDSFGLTTGEVPIVPTWVVPTSMAAVPMEPDAVMAAAWAGFADFYRAERPGLTRALALTIGDVDLATEAVDEAMTRAYQRWRTVEAMRNPTGWVYRVALNWSRSVLRTRRRREAQPQFEREAVDRGHEPADPADPAVRRALEALDVKHRAVVVCRYFLGLSEDETAQALAIRPGTAKSRLHRASKQLRVELGPLREDDA